jgi:hypothetical protein
MTELEGEERVNVITGWDRRWDAVYEYQKHASGPTEGKNAL